MRRAAQAVLCRALAPAKHRYGANYCILYLPGARPCAVWHGLAACPCKFFLGRWRPPADVFVLCI